MVFAAQQETADDFPFATGEWQDALGEWALKIIVVLFSVSYD
jgi:hypothetical protein